MIGNALQYCRDPVRLRDDEHDRRRALSADAGVDLLATAPRLPLFVGRSLPVVGNGFFVSGFAFAVGGVIVGIDVPASIGPLVLVIAVTAVSCTGGLARSSRGSG